MGFLTVYTAQCVECKDGAVQIVTLPSLLFSPVGVVINTGRRKQECFAEKAPVVC